MQEEALWACSACPHAPEMLTRSGWADHVKRSPRPYTDAGPTSNPPQGKPHKNVRAFQNTGSARTRVSLLLHLLPTA
mgnify:FL=1